MCDKTKNNLNKPLYERKGIKRIVEWKIGRGRQKTN